MEDDKDRGSFSLNFIVVFSSILRYFTLKYFIHRTLLNQLNTLQSHMKCIHLSPLITYHYLYFRFTYFIQN